MTVDAFNVSISFHGDLPAFLPRQHRGTGVVERTLSEKTAVKDAIEACGVPHVEVDLIVISGGDFVERRAVDFAWQVELPVKLEVYPVPAPADELVEAPRLQQRLCESFVADGHLGKLARNLRLLGLDTAYERDADDSRLLEMMAQQDRALITRDRRLLMHSVVRTGYCPRSSEAEEQTREVLRRFNLLRHPELLKPWTRCLRCNGMLAGVEKANVLAQLAREPLTLRYYDDFRRCTSCSRIYWAGTHSAKLNERLARLLG